MFPEYSGLPNTVEALQFLGCKPFVAPFCNRPRATVYIRSKNASKTSKNPPTGGEEIIMLIWKTSTGGAMYKISKSAEQVESNSSNFM